MCVLSARWRPIPACCTCKRPAATGCASWRGSRSGWAGHAGAGRCAHHLPGGQLPLRRPQPASSSLPATRPMRLALHPVRSGRQAGRSHHGAWAHRQVRVDRQQQPPTGVCRLRHGLCADQEPDRTRAGARRSAVTLTLFWLATRSDGHFAENQCRAWSRRWTSLSMNW
jgi:hypothetical protein